MVFVTAYDHYAVRAFEENAVDYLLKPYRRERLAEAIERVRTDLARPEELSRRLATLLGGLDAGRSPHLERVQERELAVGRGQVPVDDRVAVAFERLPPAARGSKRVSQNYKVPSPCQGEGEGEVSNTRVQRLLPRIGNLTPALSFVRRGRAPCF